MTHGSSTLPMLSLAILFPAAAFAGDVIAGSHACAACHAKKYATQIDTSMGRAMEPISRCTILIQHKGLTFHSGMYSYTITRQGDRSVYTVTDGKQTFSVALGYAFGLGDAGQTYVFSKNGNLYESRVSFYKALNGLDLTMGDRRTPPTDLIEAAGRRLDQASIHDCFGCHTSSSGGGNFNPKNRIPGVTCEHCHGSAAAHVRGFQTGKLVRMKKLEALSTEQLSTFCGQCHRTWAQIAANGPFDINNVRFQPYRLAKSQCYDPSDPRIRCVACHDPHVEVIKSLTFYDSKCLACHSSSAKAVPGKPGARWCPVSSSHCVSCHMPRLALPGSHFRFFDHDIRVVKSKAPYPG